MKKLSTITDADWEGVCDWNKQILESFISDSVELSEKTIKVYQSNLRIWFVWVKEHLNNKRQIDIKPLEYKKYQNWLVGRGASSSDANNKRAAISSLNNYIETYYADDYPLFRNFINKSIKRPAPNTVREKIPLTKAEYRHLIEELHRMGKTQILAYVVFTFEAGCRREESRQVTKECLNAKRNVKLIKKRNPDGTEEVSELAYYYTKPVRCKGGKMKRLRFGDESMAAIRAWIAERGDDDCEYLFVSRTREGDVRQIGATTFNNWLKGVVSDIVGREVHPHTLRTSRATQAVVEDGVDVKAVQKLLGHEDESTTLNYYVVRDTDDDEDDVF